ncbi:hypothetical protein MMC25_006838 [Agyrium rufum]|nr:hypothetical protein [Agyrium rufum]
MLKSTHRTNTAATAPLLTGWTEHQAPTGHTYYYNADTKSSTYTRPTATVLAVHTPTLPVNNLSQVAHPSQSPFGGFPSQQYLPAINHPDALPYVNNASFNGSRGGFNGPRPGRRPEPKDRPKSKHALPTCPSWVLVKTKLGRRFVHNPEENVSLWRFPPEVMKAVVEYDISEQEKRERHERGEASPSGEKLGSSQGAEGAPTLPKPEVAPPREGEGQNDDSDYEEVEVTDEEDDDAENPTKRSKLLGEEDEGEAGPVEFNEDDIAYQLATMGEDYGLDPGEYGNGEEEEWEEGAEGLGLTEDDSQALFFDLLDDHHINPYTPWEKIIEEGRIIDDDRYVALTTMKARKDVFLDWSRDRIEKLKEQRAKEEKKDPRIPYLTFLEKYATPKLYWPEFRRKYQKEQEMKNTKVADKEKEKLYREYINRLKLPESTLKKDLTTLLKSLPAHSLNQSTSMSALPTLVLSDIRYISLRPALRDPLIETYISTTAPAAPSQNDLSPEEVEMQIKERTERSRREKAIAEREKHVQDEKDRQRRQLHISKGVLREQEREIESARKVGKSGLMGYFEGAGKDIEGVERDAGS